MPKQPTLPTQYGYSFRHDAALNLCIAEFGTCPHGCAKDGAPNCDWHVAMNDCEPARRTADTWRIEYVPSDQLELPLL